MTTPTEARMLVRETLRRRGEAAPSGRLEVAPLPGAHHVHGEGADFIVDAATGALTGRAPVDRRRGLVTLALTILVMLVLSARAADVLSLIVLGFSAGLTSMEEISPTLVIVLALCTAVWIGVRYDGWLRVVNQDQLADLTASVAEGVTRWPRGGGDLVALRRLTWFLFFWAATWLAFTLTLERPGAKLLLLLDLAIVLITLLTGWVLLENTRGAPVVTRDVQRDGGGLGEFVGSSLRGGRWLMLAGFAQVAFTWSGASGLLFGETPRRSVLYSEVVDTALQLVVVFAVLGSKPTRGRFLAAAALFAGLVGERLLGDVGKIGLSSLTLFVALRGAHRLPVQDAVRRTAEFELLLALGRIVGRLVAGFFLGTSLVVLGEALGEQFMGLATSRRLEPVEVAVRDVKPVSAVQLRVVGYGLIAVLWACLTLHARWFPGEATVDGATWYRTHPKKASAAP